MDDFDGIQDDEDEEPTAPFWMTTYSDMVTLLLTFFVLIVAMSEVEVKKFEEALSYFNGHRSVLSYESMVPPNKPDEAVEEFYKEREAQLDALAEYLKKEDLEDKVLVSVNERGVQVSIVDSIVFESGRSELLQSSKVVLRTVSDMLTPTSRHVIVEGHTDNQPISTSQFPSNWELSGARASSVVRFFLRQGAALKPRNYKTVGYGEFRPVASNATSSGRSRNRRVEILFSHAGSE
jgi:chemotaxis protein MotB